jgi:hypothetical protein
MYTKISVHQHGSCLSDLILRMGGLMLLRRNGLWEVDQLWLIDSIGVILDQSRGYVRSYD